MNISKGRNYSIKEKCGGLGVAFLSHARLELNSLTLPVLKANRDRTARPLTESESKGNFFLPETRGKNKAMATGVASPSNIHRINPGALLMGSNNLQPKRLGYFK